MKKNFLRRFSALARHSFLATAAPVTPAALKLLCVSGLVVLAVVGWQPVRATVASDVLAGAGNQGWSKTAFDQSTGTFFLGGVHANNATNAVARYAVERQADGTNKPIVKPLAPVAAAAADCFVNGVDIGNGVATPLKDKIIGALAVTPSGKVVATNGTDNFEKVVLITDTVAGKKVFQNAGGAVGGNKNTNPMIDGANTAVDRAPIAIAASDDYSLVAIPVAAGVFGVANSGFALVRKDDKLLTVVKPETGKWENANANTAYKLNPDTKNDVAGSVSVVRDSGAGAAAATDVTVAAGADICYDAKLDRFFVGLKDVVSHGAAGIGNIGALTSLLVGRLELNNDGTKKLVLRAAVNPLGYQAVGTVAADSFDWKNRFIDNKKDQIIGTANLGTVLVADCDGAAAYKVRTMHTSTGKDYVLVNGGSSDRIDQAPNKVKLAASVYALPVMPKTLDANGADDGKAGIIAQTNGAGAYTPVGVGGVPSMAVPAAKAAAFVGVDYSYLGHKVDELPAIQDMQVAGDTVYVSVAGNRQANPNANNVPAAEAGVFASTAIFDENGNVRAWTPWERAGSSIDNAYGFGVDQKTGDVWYLTSDTGIQGAGNDKKVVKLTQWSQGATAADVHGADILNKPLAVTDATKFPTTGVLKTVNFDDETLGFAAPFDYMGGADAVQLNKTLAGAFPTFSMAVATGNGQVALMQMGATSYAANLAGAVVTDGKRFQGTFWPTKIFAGAVHGGVGGQVVVCNATTDADLAKLGPITCAEVARAAAQHKGWLFVGGKGGVAVLRQKAGAAVDGDGWDGRADQVTSLMKLANSATANDAVFPDASYSFKQILKQTGGNVFTDTRKIVCDGAYAYVLTKSKLYRLAMDTANFTDAVAPIFPDNQTVLLADLNAATNVLGQPQTTGNAAIFDASVDEFYDMVLVDGTAAAGGPPVVGGKLLLATSKGLFINVVDAQNQAFNNAAVVLADVRWKKPYDKTGTDDKFVCGPAFKLDFVSAQRGGKMDDGTMAHPASGNLYVTAVDKDDQYVCVYRFNVSSGTVKAFKEQYTETANAVIANQGLYKDNNNTDYFYKIGSVANLAGDIALGDAFDMQPQSAEYGNHGTAGDFLGGVAMTPDPKYFLNAGQRNSAIDLGADLSNGFQLASVVKDTASGALYVPGQFGVRVNE